MSGKNRYLAYIDDSGSKEYAESYAESRTRYFVFGCVLVAEPRTANLVRTLQKYKIATFGTAQVELKSNWLRMPKERKRHYLDPFSVSEEQLAAFVDLYYAELARQEFQFIGGVIDKVQMKEDYGERAYHPTAACYELILQRIENELRGNGCCSITIDDMSGKTPKNNEYNENLKNQHTSMQRVGSRMLKDIDGSRFRFTCIEGDIRIVSSDGSELIQVADIAAYNIFRQFTEHGEAWEDKKLIELPLYPYFGRLATKFRQGPERRIQGFGIAKLPMRLRRQWAVNPDDENGEGK